MTEGQPRRIDPPLTGQRSGITSVTFSPDGRNLDATGVDGTVLRWDIADPDRPQARERVNAAAPPRRGRHSPRTGASEPPARTDRSCWRMSPPRIGPGRPASFSPTPDRSGPWPSPRTGRSWPRSDLAGGYGSGTPASPRRGRSGSR
ncbi:WD40 repeat domain-containing protein [Frankia sp. CcWB3]